MFSTRSVSKNRFISPFYCHEAKFILDADNMPSASRVLISPTPEFWISRNDGTKNRAAAPNVDRHSVQMRRNHDFGENEIEEFRTQTIQTDDACFCPTNFGK